MLQYLTIPVTAFQQNCSLIWDDASMQAAVIDPGGDLDVLLDAVAKLGLQLEQVWVTHGHLDHCSGAADLAEQRGLPIIGPHRGDQFWIVPVSPHTIFPQSNESALVLRRDSEFVRLEHPGWAALSISIAELRQEAILYIDPPPVGPGVQAAEHIDLGFDLHVPIGQAAPLPTTPPPDNHRVVTLRR